MLFTYRDRRREKIYWGYIQQEGRIYQHVRLRTCHDASLKEELVLAFPQFVSVNHRGRFFRNILNINQWRLFMLRICLIHWLIALLDECRHCGRRLLFVMILIWSTPPYFLISDSLSIIINGCTITPLIFFLSMRSIVIHCLLIFLN